MSLRSRSSRLDQSPKRTAQSPMSAPLPTTLSGTLYHDTAEKAYLNDYGGGASHFSKSSVADVFEVYKEKGGVLHDRLDDSEIGDWLRFDTRAPLRVMFIDALPEEPDMLPVTESVFREVVKSFDITPRFIDNLGRQHMPGREVRRRRDGTSRHEMWYTAVLRRDGTSLNYSNVNQTAELTRKYAYWQRLCVWADSCQRRGEEAGGEHNTSTTYLILRCPRNVKQALVSTFSGKPGLKLLEHPMSIHAFIMDKVILATWDFLSHLSAPLYNLVSLSRKRAANPAATEPAHTIWQENKASEPQTPNDYAERSRNFLALSRQIYQVSTDYDILQASVEHLESQSRWFNDRHLEQHSPTADDDMEGRDTHAVVDDIFSQILNEVSLLRTYSNLYLERSKIGIDECYATTNQRDSELNISIAQASNQDNRSLRIIQVLSTVFLPGSFVSGLFGMGFFSTSDDGGVFVVNSRWWIYLAVSVPLTSVVFVVMVYYQWRDGSKAEQEWSRRISLAAASEADMEAAPRQGASGMKWR
ncbi:hypothetical protein PG993_009049 [Apiospora rasikravindrae]|uniref:Uncharacterized protein n=1 Tax=Apiospora rasikravindrae TaxID=990691 RepID=A0ABR1SK11_9PEZI